MPSLAVSALVVGSIAAPVNLANGLNDCPGACAGGGFNAGCAYFSDPDEGLAEQWYIEAVGACGAWELGFTGRGVTVGILDYGILQDHPDLAGQVEPAGRGGCSEEEPDPLPPPSVRDWHGTNMAGIVGAGAGEPTGMCSNVVGIAFGARLAEVFLWNGSGFDDGEIADALAYRNDCIHVKVNSYDLSGSLPRYAFLGSGAELALEESVAAG
ncbi:MAG TPA: S8 family serine peptidase, partial [Phycisphaerales bacterium]|nr:S8 family serine peptidase [Phycisphaerales bacterium]